MRGINDNWNEQVKFLRLGVDQDKEQALGGTSQTLDRPFGFVALLGLIARVATVLTISALLAKYTAWFRVERERQDKAA